MYAELKDKGLELVALNGTDSADVINKYIKANNFTFLIGMKGKGDNYDAALQYRVQLYPTNYVLDSDGKVVFRSVDFDEAGIRAALEKLSVK